MLVPAQAPAFVLTPVLASTLVQALAYADAGIDAGVGAGVDDVDDRVRGGRICPPPLCVGICCRYVASAL